MRFLPRHTLIIYYAYWHIGIYISPIEYPACSSRVIDAQECLNKALGYHVTPLAEAVLLPQESHTLLMLLRDFVVFTYGAAALLLCVKRMLFPLFSPTPFFRAIRLFFACLRYYSPMRRATEMPEGGRGMSMARLR